jgi:hypothetical protein
MLTLRRNPTAITRTAADYIGDVRRLALLTAAALLTLPGLAQARPAAKTVKPKLWATVNVCDTAKHPDTIGIRASMPGNGTKKIRMYMRFQVQFQAADGTWKDLVTPGDDTFTFVGSAKFRRRESGRNVTLKPPAPGTSYLLRGLVTFEWRRGATVTRRATRFTQAGHRGTTGSDPKGLSAADCRVAG